MLGRVEALLYTVADAAVAAAPEAEEAAGDWLSGITNSMETVLKVRLLPSLLPACGSVLACPGSIGYWGLCRGCVGCFPCRVWTVDASSVFCLLFWDFAQLSGEAVAVTPHFCAESGMAQSVGMLAGINHLLRLLCCLGSVAPRNLFRGILVLLQRSDALSEHAPK
jgi:hypothetical protein